MVGRLLLPDSKAELGAQVAGQGAQATVLNVGAMMLTFVTSLVLTRGLGAGGYGAYVYALAWATMLSVGAQLGYSHLLVRNIAAYSARCQWGLVRGIVRRSQRLIVPTSILLALAAAVGGSLFLGHGQPQVRRSFFIALLLVPAMALIGQREAVLRGYRRIALGRLPETTVQPLLLLASIGILYAALGKVTASLIMGATVVAAIGAVAVGTAFVRRVTPPQVRSATLETDVTTWSRSARSLFAINGLQVVNLQMSLILLGVMKTVDATAIFSVALRLSGLVFFLQTAIAFPLAPAFAKLHSTGSKADVQRLASKAGAGVLLLSSPIVVGLLFLGPRALDAFGRQFRDGSTALTILVLGELVNIASGFAGVILINTGRESTLFRVAAWLTGLKVALSVPLIQLFGLEGAALSQAIGSGVMNVVLAIVVWRQLGVYSPGIGRRWIGTRGG